MSDVYGVSFDLEFPTKLMNYRRRGATEGVFLKGDDNADTELIVENEPDGNLVIGYSRVGPEAGVDGSGHLFSLEFALVATGSGSFDLNRTDVLDPLGEVQNGVAFVGGSISVAVN